MMGDRERDLLSKAVGKMGQATEQAIAAARQQRRIEAERRTLEGLRAEALSLRAQIGEEMYTLWRAGALPPSSLDPLFVAVERTMEAIADQVGHLQDLREGRIAGGTITIAAAPNDDTQVIDATPMLPPPPVPAARTQRLAGTAQSASCPTCGAADVGDGAYCGYCGTRL